MDPCAFGIFELAKIPAHIGCSATILMESISLIMGVPNAVSYVPGWSKKCFNFKSQILVY